MMETFEEGKTEPTGWEQANAATALWTLPKNKIKAEEYNELYKQIAHDFSDPLLTIHNRVEGKHDYTSLLFVPSRAPFDLFQRDRKSGIKLYVKRTYIMDDAENMMPNYLRFIKGVIDSSDLPLNVSREILQNNKLIDSIRSASVKKILSTLESLAEKDAEKYQTFWAQFGNVLKEGPTEDFANKDRIAKLLRFRTTTETTDTVSLMNYIDRMQENQDYHLLPNS